MRSNFIKLSLTLLVVLYFVTSTEGSCAEYGYAYTGNNIGDYETFPSWQECATRCYGHATCLYYTFYIGTNQCYLKTSSAGREENDSSISGYFTCTDECWTLSKHHLTTSYYESISTPPTQILRQNPNI